MAPVTAASTRSSVSGAAPGPRPHASASAAAGGSGGGASTASPSAALSPVASHKPPPPPPPMSPMSAPASSSPAAAAGGSGGAGGSFTPYVFSKGHGAHSDTEPLKPHRTEIRPDAVASVNKQRAHAKDGKEHAFSFGKAQVEFVPRSSDPSQYRAIVTKSGGGGGGGVFTSYPMDPARVPPAALTAAGISASQVVHAPHSPRAASASGSASGSASAPPSAPPPPPSAPSGGPSGGGGAGGAGGASGAPPPATPKHI